MTEESTTALEVSVEQGCYRAIIRASSWSQVLTQARVAKIKMQIVEVACPETVYDFAGSRWRVIIPKQVGIIRNRIALALLLVFPDRILREDLSIMSSVQMGSLNNYLTKPELEVQAHIDENEEGIRLNSLGYTWASGILKPMADQGGSPEEEIDDERGNE